MKDTVTIKCIDLADDMQAEAVSCATKVSDSILKFSCCKTMASFSLTQYSLRVQAVELHAVEKEVASYIKKHFDAKYKPTWHCVVGKSFGEPSFSTYHGRTMDWPMVTSYPYFCVLQAPTSHTRAGTSYTSTLVRLPHMYI